MENFKSVQNHGDRIVLYWDDGSFSVFHAIWLRDNCHCPQCGDAATGRRTQRLSELDLDVSISNVAYLPAKQPSIEINWSDGHLARFAVNWLIQYRYDDRARANRSVKSKTWSAELRRDPPVFQFDEAITSQDVLLDLLQTIQDNGICFLRGAAAEAGVLESFARLIGFPQESNFGRLQDLVFDRSKSSIANDVTALKPHTDEPYRASPPGILMFHCIETDIAGAGASIFTDGFDAAEQLREEDPEGFHALTTNNQEFRRFFRDDVDVSTSFPVISIDEYDNITGVRINDRVAAPANISSEKIPLYYRGMKRLLTLTEDESRWIKHTLTPGDIVIFDNHRILHGRTQLTMTGKRWLQWLQIERGDLHSTIRILSDRLGIQRSPLPFPRGAYR